MYFTGQSDPERPYDLHLNRVALDGTDQTQLTEGKGRHTAVMAPSHGYFVDTYSSVDTPPRSVLRRADGELVLTLSEADIGRLEEVGWTPPREVVVKATGGINDTGTQADLFQMSETLVRAGIQHDMMVYANTGHGAFGQTGEYNMELKKNYLVKHLLNVPVPGVDR